MSVAYSDTSGVSGDGHVPTQICIQLLGLQIVDEGREYNYSEPSSRGPSREIVLDTPLSNTVADLVTQLNRFKGVFIRSRIKSDNVYFLY